MLPSKGVFRGYMKLVTLYVLRERPSHVYGLIKSIEDLVGVRPSTGVIYPILRSSIRDGLVVMESSVVDGRVVKTYRLSEEGLKYLELHRDELRDALRLAESFKKLRSVGCERLFRVVREVVVNAWRLKEEDLIELRKAVSDFEVRVLEILSRSGGVRSG